MIDLGSFDKYQKEARKTAIYPNLGSNLSYPVLGLAGETGEVAENVKKVIRDDNGVVTYDRKTKLFFELGDVLWYVANIAAELNMSLSEIARGNLGKLYARKAQGKLHGSGSNR